MFLSTWLEKLKSWEEEATLREKVLVAIIITILPLFLFYKFYFSPINKKIEILKTDIQKLDLEIKKYKQKAKRLKILKSQIEERKKFLERIEKIFPPERKLGNILNDLSEITKNNHVELIVFKEQKEKPQDYYNVLPFNIKIRGRFSDTINFLNDLESLERLIVINSVKFQMTNDGLYTDLVFHTFKYTGKPLEKEKKRKK